ncbi:MAG: pilus assembly protein TadG-related protein, partial [Acidimicrobiia bacterium]
MRSFGSAFTAIGSLDARDRQRRSVGGLGEQRGAVLPIMALLLVVLMGVAGFAVDLGWLLWNSIEIQHGADAAALGGVVYVADDAALAGAEGRAAAASNGYVDTTLGGPDTVELIDFSQDPSAVANAFQLRATITHEVPTFFIKVFGINSLSIARTAVAEYVLPLPMGSPESYFGNDPALGRWPNFWGNIHGYYTGKGMGDRYASQCIKWESASGCTKNDERRQSVNAGAQEAAGGYLYGIEIDPASVGSILTVELFDPQFTRGGGNNVLVGDNPQGGSPGPTTTFMLYTPDPTPLNTTDGGNFLECSVTYDPRDPYADFNGDGKVSKNDDQDGDGDLDWDDVELAYPGGVAALWEPFCSIPINEAGIFPLRIMVNDSGGADQRGLNRWSMRAFTSGGPAPRVYGLGDMAIYANVDG